jgi:hypothetical protein
VQKDDEPQSGDLSSSTLPGLLLPTLPQESLDSAPLSAGLFFPNHQEEYHAPDLTKKDLTNYTTNILPVQHYGEAISTDNARTHMTTANIPRRSQTWIGQPSLQTCGNIESYTCIEEGCDRKTFQTKAQWM